MARNPSTDAAKAAQSAHTLGAKAARLDEGQTIEIRRGVGDLGVDVHSLP